MAKMSDFIFKIGAIILNENKQILVVRKIFKDRVDFIIPGGRQEAGENDEQTLTRELQEELGVKLVSMSFFGRFEEVSIFENIPLIMHVYEAEIAGTPNPQSEIKECVWVSRDYQSEGYALGTVLSKHVIPHLVRSGKM